MIRCMRVCMCVCARVYICVLDGLLVIKSSSAMLGSEYVIQLNSKTSSTIGSQFKALSV